MFFTVATEGCALAGCDQISLGTQRHLALFIAHIGTGAHGILLRQTWPGRRSLDTVTRHGGQDGP